MKKKREVRKVFERWAMLAAVLGQRHQAHSTTMFDYWPTYRPRSKRSKQR